ncbi:MAG: glycosyltransferase family 1 protein [Oscillospiraceae bacterium]|nr:glycosyltransferase family 1 protein [Oscillospiraceae bacterium]
MPIRILHIVTYMGRGGLETFLMNVYRNIDREKLQFDFLVHRKFRADYDDEIEELGGIIHRLPRLNPFSPQYHMSLLAFFKDHPEYRIVHCHLDCMSGIPLAAAKKYGVPVRIAHSHTINQDKDWKYPLKRLCMRKIPTVATHFFACSKKAGAWMFPSQRVTVINNGIETQRFAFDPQVCAEVRSELMLRDELVLGHVGRFAPVKNHELLTDIFDALHKKEPASVLLLVGQGPLEPQIRKKVQQLGLDDCVRFLGLREDVNRILQAVDVFVMPSLYEGLSLSTIEAQTTGAYCIFSDTIPAESQVADNVEFIALDAPVTLWADRIIAGAAMERTSKQEAVAAKGYDIRVTSDYLQNFYQKNW